jgi:hypothetical protein
MANAESLAVAVRENPARMRRAGDVAGADQPPLDLRPREQIRLKVSPS